MWSKIWTDKRQLASCASTSMMINVHCSPPPASIHNSSNGTHILVWSWLWILKLFGISRSQSTRTSESSWRITFSGGELLVLNDMYHWHEISILILFTQTELLLVNSTPGWHCCHFFCIWLHFSHQLAWCQSCYWIVQRCAGGILWWLRSFYKSLLYVFLQHITPYSPNYLPAWCAGRW